MAAASYLPDQDGKRVAWMQNFSTLISASPATYGLDAGAAATIAAAVSAFVAAYPASIGATASRDTRAFKNAKLDAAKHVVREYGILILRNPAVSDGAKGGLGLFGTEHRSRFDKPPKLTVLGVKNRSVVLTYANANNKALPEQDSACQVFAGADPRRLRLFAESTKCPFTLRFHPPFNGGSVYLKARWVDDEGHVSPFGPLCIAIVPYIR
jgi:hypothetical protein